MNKLIFPSQSAFLKGRMLIDGVMVINELVDLARRSRKVCLIFKVDLEKTYDLVSWSFLKYMLIRFDINDKWRSWIRAFVFSGNLVVLVNNSPSQKI